jgi:hypothetical protein
MRHSRIFSFNEYCSCVECPNTANTNANNDYEFNHGCKTQLIVGIMNGPDFELRMKKLLREYKLQRILK